MRSILELNELIAEKREEADAIIAAADTGDRHMTKAEKKRFDEICGVGEPGQPRYKPGEIGELKEEKQRAQKREDLARDRIQARIDSGEIQFPGGSGDGSKKVLTNSRGETARLFAKGESIAAYAAQQRDDGFGTVSTPHAMGELMRAMVTGPTSSTPMEIRNVLSEGTSTAGGVLVPTYLTSNVIDLARARSVLGNAGMSTLITEGPNTTIARITQDPPIEVKAENDAFTDQDITFDGVSIGAFTFGCVVTASRELAEDAPNFSMIIEQTLARALAADVDKLGLTGTGTTEPLGIMNTPGVSETGSVGAINWPALSAAALAVRANNYEPNSWVSTPQIAHALLESTTTDGDWLGPPPTLSGVTNYNSTHVTTDEIIVGAFPMFVLGLRKGVTIESSTVAGDAFQKHQVKFKITWRGDFASMDDNAFHLLDGVTAS